MNELKLPFASTGIILIECTVDDIVHEYTVVDSAIIIQCNLTHGFHSLCIKLLSNNIEIKIQDALLDDESVRHTLYMMYTVDNQTSAKRQTTILTDYDNTIYLPFINPIAQWISVCSEKVPYNLMADGLYESYEVYYPKSIIVSNKYPKIIQDFFAYDSGFHLHPKVLDAYYNITVPFAGVETKINYDEKLLADELITNVEYLKNMARKPKQSAYTSSNNPWTVVDVIINETAEFNLSTAFRADQSKLPNLYKFLKNLNIDRIVHAFVGILAPGEYITPHCDTYQDFDNIPELVGCSQIYIPINFKSGNLFKFSNVGSIPLDGPVLVNNHNFAHALINDSNEYRFGVGIVGTRLHA
jgi:hypothetical protein